MTEFLVVFSNWAWRLLNLKNDAKIERIKAQTHTWKTNEIILNVKTLIEGSLQNEQLANINSKN
jgi:hypothetical protein